MKILLIDDSTLSRNILKRVLGEGHQFIEADEGMRGLELFFIEKPDLVFLDLTMPGTNGLDILQQLRQVDSQARVIVGTADIQEYSRLKALELGASAYLTKPFTPDSIAEAVRKAMEQTNSAGFGPSR